MQCLKPYLIMPQGIQVPCGQCKLCKISRAREWSIRLMHEMSCWQDAIFVTLTYNDQNLKSKSIQKVDLQKFFKRLRKNLNGRKIKYYACGEYGERKLVDGIYVPCNKGELGRPHYHAIIFGISIAECNLNKYKNPTSCALADSWLYGNIVVDEVNYKTCRYVAQYIDKKYNGDLAKEIYINRGYEVPFQLSSNGFGLQYCQKNKKNLIEDLYLSWRGLKLGIPRYYRKKLNITSDDYKKLHIDSFGVLSDGAHLHHYNADQSDVVKYRVSQGHYYINDMVKLAGDAMKQRLSELNTQASRRNKKL